MRKENLLDIAIQASIKAGKAILNIYDLEEIEVFNKNDESPLTMADITSNNEITSLLKKTGIPIISEENKSIDSTVRSKWKTCWIIDPLDGTKEFIKRNGEFTVNVALVSENTPILGVIYVPVTRELFFSHLAKQKAYKVILDANHEFEGKMMIPEHEVSPKKEYTSNIKVVGSRSHMNEETEVFVKELNKKYDSVEIVSVGSSLKFCLVIEGKADIYPRFAPTMEWDTAAGHALCRSVGLNVVAKETGEPLLYNKEKLLNDHFIVK